MLSIVLHGIVWYCMELLCILWYRIFSCHSIVLYGIVLYLTVLHGIALLASARCISQDTYQFYLRFRQC